MSSSTSLVDDRPVGPPLDEVVYATNERGVTATTTSVGVSVTTGFAAKRAGVATTASALIKFFMGFLRDGRPG